MYGIAKVSSFIKRLFSVFASNSNRSSTRPSCLVLRFLAILAASPLWLLVASTSSAQAATPIDPYVWQKCVTDNNFSYGTNYYRDCAISPPTDVVTPPFYWTVGTDGSVATNSDGSLSFLGAVEAIHVFARNTTTGDITYQGCVSDRGSSGTGNNAPPDCAGLASYYGITAYAGQFAGTAADWNIGYNSGNGVIRMAVFGDDLYAGTQQRLLHFKIVAGPPTTLSLHACWRSVSDASAPSGTVLDSCQVLQTPGMDPNGHLIFTSMSGPAAAPDGSSIYALITTGPNIVNSVVQADSHISAVLNFTRDPTTGELTYQDCAGLLEERIGDFPSISFADHPCGYGNLYGFRNAGAFAALSVTPDGHSLVVAGMGGDTTTCPNPSDVSNCRPWAVALLARGNEVGELSNQQCILLPSGGTCPGVSSPYDNVAAGTANPFNVTFAPSNAAGLSDVYLETNQYNAAIDPTTFILHPTSGTYNLVSTPGNTSDVRLTGFPYDHLYQVAPKNGQLFAINQPNSSSLGNQLAIFHPDASNSGLLTYTDCAAGPNFYYPYSTPCPNNTILPENLNARQMAFTPDGGTLFTMGNYVAGFVTVQAPQFTLTINSDHGTVTSSPTGINCQTTNCTANFTSGANVQLTATPASGYVFSSWSGDCSGTTSPCSVNMSAAKTVTANFTATLAPPPTPSGFNATLTSVSIRKRATYSGNLSWNDTATETGYLIQRYVTTKTKGKNSCVLDTKFSATAPQNATTYTDTSASSSTCGYGLAATNAVGTSAFAIDYDLTN